MDYSYRYLSKKDKAISFSLILTSLLVIASGLLGFILSVKIEDLNGWIFFGVVAIIFTIIAPIWISNERFIKKRCIWDKVSINNEKISSLRYGDITLKDIKRFKENDLSKVYSFSIKTEKSNFKFSCLSFLGDEGGSEYTKDNDNIKSLGNEIKEVIKNLDNEITPDKESTSNILFLLICLAMALLIPGLIFAPLRMIFVIPFIVPLFFIALKKRSESKKKNKGK